MEPCYLDFGIYVYEIGKRRERPRLLARIAVKSLDSFGRSAWSDEQGGGSDDFQPTRLEPLGRQTDPETSQG